MVEKFREYITKSGTTVLAGRNSKNNEKLIAQVEKDEEVFHTQATGSPFVNIKGKPKKGDVKEACLFCARYSQDWKKNKCNILSSCKDTEKPRKNRTNNQNKIRKNNKIKTNRKRKRNIRYIY